MSDQPPLVRRALGPGTGEARLAWEAVPVAAYKGAEAPHRDVTRQVLFAPEPALPVEWRYFEVGPGGHSTLERHAHLHSVMVVMGRGEVLVGATVTGLAPLDLVRVPPMTWHQFRAAADAPLGFLCLVNAERDRPQLPTEAELTALRQEPAIARFIRV